jgi:molecular chaperone DnaK (HSP70)
MGGGLGLISFCSEVTYEVAETLKKQLYLARQKWDEMGLSMTPRWHMLLNHAINFLIRTGGGLIEMGKDQIERAHQLQERDRQQYSCLRNVSKMKALQAKYQNLRLEPEIKLARATVEEKSKRNLKRTVSLAEENLKSARATRNEIRESVFEEAKGDG